MKGDVKTTMKFYLAAPFAMRVDMHKYREELVEMGHEVTSRWLDKSDDPPTDEDYEQIAQDDLGDIESANAIVCFTQAPGPYYTGARHVEFGIAMAYGMVLFVIGYRENAFYHHPDVGFYNTWEEFVCSNL